MGSIAFPRCLPRDPGWGHLNAPHSFPLLIRGQVPSQQSNLAWIWSHLFTHYCMSHWPKRHYWLYVILDCVGIPVHNLFCLNHLDVVLNELVSDYWVSLGDAFAGIPVRFYKVAQVHSHSMEEVCLLVSVTLPNFWRAVLISEPGGSGDDPVNLVGH